MPTANKEYKDRLFSFLFGQEDHKDWTLSLYNAINQTNYTDPGKIQINTIRQVLYLSMHNDVSFLLAGEINLYEQQSTYSPNMPLRMMEYIGNIYERYLTEHRLNRFARSQIRLPVPRLVVLYNGTEEMSEKQILRLSDAFPKGADSDIEVRVLMLNINAKKNLWLKEGCEPLREYSWLVDEIRKRKKTSELSEAIDASIYAMPRSFTIRPFITAHLAEVKGMLLTEYDEKEAMELFREEGIAEGREQGIAEGLAQGIAEGRKQEREKSILSVVAAYRDCDIDDGVILGKIMDKFELSEDQAREYLKRCE